MIKSDCRGLGRKMPAPNRSISNREAPVAIISMAQQARPNVIGQRADLRAQLIKSSTVVVMMFFSKRSSIQAGMIALSVYLWLRASRLRYANLRPVEGAFLNNPNVSDDQDAEENKHLGQ